MSSTLALMVAVTLAPDPDATEEPAETTPPEELVTEPPEEQPTVSAPEDARVEAEVAPARVEPRAAREEERVPKERRAREDEKSDEVDQEKKLVTRQPGDWGMTFTFGGLAPMSIAGINDFTINRLLFSELGFRAVLKRVVIPFSVGAGFFSHRPENGGDLGDVGVAASVAVLADFRVRRRIKPHAGGALHLHYVDPSGRSNYLFNFSFGPVIGIEYFFASRVSLLLQGKLNVGFNVLDGLTQIDFGTIVAAGGQMGLTFYF
jgi:hypothetical protein